MSIFSLLCILISNNFLFRDFKQFNSITHAELFTFCSMGSSGNVLGMNPVDALLFLLYYFA